MDEKILDTIKKSLGLPADYTPFDTDVTMFINMALSDLDQLGVAPSSPLRIDSGDEVWSDLIPTDENMLNSVQSYIHLRVRLLFDPPGNSFTLNAVKEQIKELEWRINVRREGSVL